MSRDAAENEPKDRPAAPPPRGAVALRLLARWRETDNGGLLYLTGSERIAEYLGANIHALAPDCPILVFPRWDCLPYDPAGPSREVMGRRVSVLRRLAEGITAPLVIATAEAALQRVAPRDLWAGISLALRRGDTISAEQLQGFFEQAGYTLDMLVDEPGEAVVHGQVVDVFPAGALGPVRIEHDGERIAAISSYDPASQRTTDDLDAVVLDAASELLRPPGEERAPPESPWLCDRHPELETIFEYLPDAAIVCDPAIPERVSDWRERVQEAYAGWRQFPDETGAGLHAPAPDRLYIAEAEWRKLLKKRQAETLDPADWGGDRIPLFATQPNPSRAFRDFIEAQLAEGRRVVLSAAEERDLRTMIRRAQPAATSITRVEDWEEVLAAAPQTALALRVDFDAGFVDPAGKVAVIAAADLLGSRAGHQVPMELAHRFEPGGEPALRLGDAVVHLEHGIGLLRGIETVAAEGMPDEDAIRLEYYGGATLLAPVQEIGAVWRYGGDPEAVSLDRLDGEAWRQRRDRIEAEIADTARALAELTRERNRRTAPVLTPPARDYERFVAAFPFTATADQARAVEDILADLKSGRPMDRLVCGDVGFGKTEVALRAAAAAALAGKQVAVVAPTTVLVRQHVEIFRRRFAPFGIAVAQLSRLTKPADARAVKKGLADGSIGIVVGTHAIAGKGVGFKDLALLIIDEEQRFGTRIKTKLRDFAEGLHVLTMSATPIPRTLQCALSGLQSLSVLATPPARRLPVRTIVRPFAPELLREALLYERRRAGQSFVVCPRIEDIEPLSATLRELVPGLRLRIAHGKMPADEIDETMVAFADGRGDVLLATNIIESGLDLPRANTIVIWRPDRFGAAQLHQLRGRVGRGSRRGIAYLLTEPGVTLTGATGKRLQLLAEQDRLGAGFAISERDMDLRGAGDLLGEQQAGHVRLIGAELYRHLLDRARARLETGDTEAEWEPELNLDLGGRIPEEYVADPEVRINLYARLARLRDLAAIDAFGDELEDRFGEMPPEVHALIELARLRETARPLGIRRIDAGPRAIALSFDPARADEVRRRLNGAADLQWKEERLIFDQAAAPENRTAATLTLLETLAAQA